MRPSAVFAEFCAFLINCPHPCVTETGEEEMLKRQCCTKTIPVKTELCDRKYWSRNDCYLWVPFLSPSTQFLLLILPFFTQFYTSQENDILSSDRLERHIANITPLDRWLATIRNRPSQLAELSHSKFDPKLFSHVQYVNFL